VKSYGSTVGTKAFLKLGFNLGVLGRREDGTLGSCKGVKNPGRRIYLGNYRKRRKGGNPFLGKPRDFDRALEDNWRKKPVGGKRKNQGEFFRKFNPLGEEFSHKAPFKKRGLDNYVFKSPYWEVLRLKTKFSRRWICHGLKRAF